MKGSIKTKLMALVLVLGDLELKPSKDLESFDVPQMLKNTF